MRKELGVVRELEREGGFELRAGREEAIERYLTQDHLSDAERLGALRELRALQWSRRSHDIAFYWAGEDVSARRSGYAVLLGGRARDTERHRKQLALVRKDAELVQKEFDAAATDKAYEVLHGSVEVIAGQLRTYGFRDSTPVHGAIMDVHIRGRSVERAAADWLEKVQKIEHYKQNYDSRDGTRKRAGLEKAVHRLSALQANVKRADKAESDAFDTWQKRHEPDKYKARKTPGVFDAINLKPRITPKERPKDSAHAAAWDRLQEARAELNTAWLEAERAHPVLAAYRGKATDLSNVSLGKTGSIDARMHRTLVPLLEKLVNIHEAIAALKQGKLNPLALKPIVAATKQDLLIKRGSVWDKVVNDLVANRDKSTIGEKLLDALLLAMSLTVIGGVAVAGLEVVKEYAKYDMERKLSNTALDQAKSISDADPSLAGLVMAALGGGMAVGEAAMLFNKARTLKKAIEETGDRAAIKELNELGEAYHVRGLGDDAAKAAQPKRPAPAVETPPKNRASAEPPSPKRPSSGSSGGGPGPPARPTNVNIKPTGKDPVSLKDLPKPKPPAKPDKPQGYDPTQGPPKPGGKRANPFPAPVDKPPKMPPPIAKPKLDHDLRLSPSQITPIGYSDAAKVRQGAADEFKQLSHGVRRSPEEKVLLDDIINSIDNSAESQWLKSVYNDYHQTLRDPDAYAEFTAHVWQHAAAKNMTPRQALEDLVLGGGKPTAVTDQLTKYHMSKEGGIIDLAFNGDKHGTHTHLFQEGLLNFKHGKGAGKRFRRAIGNAKGSRVRLPNGKWQEFYSTFWNAMFDVLDGNHINRPEVLQPVLERHLGLPRRITP